MADYYKDHPNAPLPYSMTLEYRRAKYRAAGTVHQVAKAAELKQQLVAYKGGCCMECGYSRSLHALEFDHLDPRSKTVSLAALISRHAKWTRLVAEADKCDLVCSNCHRERTHARMTAKRLARLANPQLQRDIIDYRVVERIADAAIV